MSKKKSIIAVAGILLLAACAEEIPPGSVQEFVDNRRLLEATMVRCAENRATMKYEAECINAREAINRIEATEERARREQLEAQSERKRQALRRTQQAAAEARRRALEAQRMREEAEYLGLFEQPAAEAQPAAAPHQQAEQNQTVVPQTTAQTQSELPAAPQRIIETESPEPESEEPTASDLQSIREELQRRRDEQDNN